jgi:hypothetical protein
LAGGMISRKAIGPSERPMRFPHPRLSPSPTIHLPGRASWDRPGLPGWVLAPTSATPRGSPQHILDSGPKPVSRSERNVLERFGEALTEHEVEISEDVFLLKAEDAQKLLEPPRLHRLLVHPDRVDLHPNEHAGFTVNGTDQYGRPFPIENPSWSAPGCTVGQDGQVRVGETLGLYVVTARCSEIEAQAQIRVQALDSGKRPDGSDRKGSELDEAKVIHWSGTIPPQKWTTFYMKVVSPFASVPGLSLRVEVELPADKDGQQAKAQLEKIRSALRDLNLDEGIEIS